NSAFDYNLGATNNADLVAVNGDLTFNGGNDVFNIVNALPGLNTGTYAILTATGTINGFSASTFHIGNTPSDYSFLNYAFAKNGNEIDLVVTAPGSKTDVWTGAVNGAWDKNTSNFTSGGNPVAFKNGDTAQF